LKFKKTQFMNTQNSNIQTEKSDFSIKKQSYIQPEIRFIQLDNEISLALESNPPDTAPGEGVYNIQNPYNSPQLPLT